jgi:hypothetical protein
MAQVVIVDVAGMDAAAYERVMDRLDLGDRMPPGGVWHHAGPSPSGWRAVDLWESPGAFERFGEERLQPLFAELGFGPPKIEMLEVHEIRDGTFADAALLQVVRLPGIDRETFKAADVKITGGQAPEHLVHHCNGTTGAFSWVVDTWTSKDARDAFMEAHVRPTMESAPLTGPPVIEDLEIRNRIAVPTEAKV